MQGSPGRQTEAQNGTEADRADHDSLNRSLRRKWLKRLFWLWIGGTALVALYLGIAGPLTAFTGLEKPHVALVVVPFLLLLLFSGLVWLILLVRSRR